jgi:alpha-ribazole phosphatase
VGLWLIRHARPLIEDGICYGRLDVPADGSETQTAAQRLAEVLPAGIDVLSSPLQRCQQLARALQLLRPDLPVRTEARLAEMDFGAWEGRRWDNIDRQELEAWSKGFQGYRAGGNGESVATFTARVGQVFDEVCGRGGQAWITHGGVFKVAWLRRHGVALESAAQWPKQALAWGAWHLFDGEPKAGEPQPLADAIVSGRILL